MFILKYIIICGICFISAYAQDKSFTIPEMAGIEVTAGETIIVPTKGKVKTAVAFKFADGSIICGDKGNTFLSTDNGHSWSPREDANLEKAMINLSNGESLAVSRNSHKKANDKFRIDILRSGDNWQTQQKEEAEIEIPDASFTVTGSGSRVDGFLFHHGLLELANGDLIGSMYGNFEGDMELCAGYPSELNQRKYHTIVVFSKDKGRTWGNYVHVAYDKMLGRGIPDDHDMIGKSIPPSMVNRTAVVPAVTMEGFRESDLVQAANGDLLCIMRSGGRNPIKEVALFPTPLYCSRSQDSGKSWSPPLQIADRGVSPNAVTLKNGIIVCTYSRPGNWLIFSDDDGKSWKGAFRFADGRATNYIINSGRDSVQVFYEAEINDETKLLATFFTVKRK